MYFTAIRENKILAKISEFTVYGPAAHGILVLITWQTIKAQVSLRICTYGKCSKVSNTSYLTKRPRQIGQTLIRLLLKKQSDQGLPYLLL